MVWFVCHTFRLFSLFLPYDPSLYDMFWGDFSVNNMGVGCGCHGFYTLARLKCFGGGGGLPPSLKP